MKYIFLFIAICTFAACSHDHSKTNELQDELNKLQTENKELSASLNDPTFMHTVYIWLKKDLSDTDRSKFLTEVKKLKAIQSVARFRMGTHEDTDGRGVVDHSYSYALNIEFDSVKDHDAYQIDPIHLEFVEQCKDLWDKVIVYDNKF